MRFNHKKTLSTLSACLLGTALLSGSIAQSKKLIPRSLLVDMARSQYTALCQSEAFAQCMGFTSEACLALSEEVVSQCLLPLPEEISPEALENSALEACPITIFSDAGYSEQQAEVCFDSAMAQTPK